MKLLRLSPVALAIFAAACATVTPTQTPDHWLGVLRTSSVDSPERREAGVHLAAHGEAAVPAIVKALGDRDATVRRHALGLVMHLGPGARDAVPAVARLVASGDAGERFVAIIALGDVGPGAGKAVPSLVRALKDRTGAWPDMRTSAADSLGRIGSAASDAIPALAAGLRTDDPKGTFHAAVKRALRRILRL